MNHPQQEEMTRYGFYGLIPFVVSAVAVWLSPWLTPQHVALDFHRLALICGAVTVAYLSGIGAGSMLAPKLQQGRGFLPGMLVVIAAFFAVAADSLFFVSVGAVWRHLIILLLLIYLLMRDLSAVSAGLLPAWYGQLRVRLTFWASLSLVLIMSRLLVWGYY